MHTQGITEKQNDNAAQRERRNAGIQPLAYQSGGRHNTTPLRQIPRYAEEFKRKPEGIFAGGDFAPVNHWRDDKPPEDKLAHLKNEQYSAAVTTMSQPPSLIRKPLYFPEPLHQQQMENWGKTRGDEKGV